MFSRVRFREAAYNSPFMPWIVFALCMALAWAVFLDARDSDRGRLQLRLEADVETCKEFLEHDIETNLQAVDHLNVFLQTVPQVERRLFNSFAAKILQDRKAIRALEWIPRVPHDGRSASEAAARRDGFPGFQFTERSDGQGLVPAGRRDEYFPVYFVEPYTNNETAIGYDLASERVRKAMLETARDSGTACATQPITLVQQRRNRCGVLIAKPLYDGEGTPESVAARREKLKGYALAVIDASDIAEGLAAHRSKQPLRFLIYDKGAAPSNKLVHMHSPKPDPPNETFLPATNRGAVAAIQCAKEVKVADRIWVLLCSPATGNADYAESPWPWFLLLAGGVFGALISVQLNSQLNQTRTVSAMVEARTQELTLANRKLQDEMEVRAQAEALLAQSEAKYRIVADNAYDWECWTRQDNAILYCSPSCERITGYRADEFIAHPGLMVSIIHPEDRGAYDAHVKARLGPNSFEVAPSELVFRVIRRDGGVRWIQHICRMADDVSGKPAGWRVSNRDITESKEAGEMLRLSEENLLAFFNTIHDMLFVLDEEGKVLRVNQTVVDQLGYAEEELLGRSVMDVHPEARREEEGHVVADMLTGKTEFCSIPLITKEGKLIAVETRITRGRWNDKPALFGTCKDVTALWLSEEKFARAFRNNPSPMAITSLPDRCFLDVNQAFLKITGYTRSEVIGFTSAELGLFVRPDVVRDTNAILAADGRIRDLDVAVRRKDGSIRYGLFFAEKVELQDKRVLLSVMHDITERKLAEERDRNRQQVLEMLAADAPLKTILEFIVGLVEKESPSAVASILLVDQDGKRLRHGAAPGLPDFYNAAVDGLKIADGVGSCGTAAATKKTVIVEDVQDHPYWASFRDLAQRAGVRSCWSQPILSVTGQVLGTFAIYHRTPHSLGSEERDRIHYAAGIAGTVIEHCQVEDALQRSEERFRLTTTTARDAIVMVDSDDKVTFWNKAAEEMLGYSSSEALGRELHPWLAPERYRDAYRKGFAIFRTTGEGAAVGKTLELVAMRKDGVEVPIELSLSVTRFGGQWHALAIMRDITERRRVMEELRQAKEAADSANNAKSQFLAHMSHEIRTPLNAVLGFTQLLLREPDLAAPHRNRLEAISSNGEHLLTLITDVLDMSKIETGRLTLQTSSFELPALLKHLEQMFRARAQTKQLQFDMKLIGEIPHHVSGDEGKIKQSLINLIGNAVKFTDRGGVMVRVRAVEKEANICRIRTEIEDTGRGISPKDINLLFQPFAQAGKNPQRVAGSGLGLYISRQFARLMGGDIAVTSQVGVGSSFQFEFAVELTASRSAAEAMDTRLVKRLQPGQPSYRVLIVDDVKDNRVLLDQMLGPAGFVCFQVANGFDALAGLKEWKPHLILMDVHMPGMDGNETIRRIRAGAEHRDVKIIGITASAFEADKQATLSAGADCFLAKPIRREGLFAQIGALLGVEYLYEDELATPTPHADSSAPGLLTRESMSLLPAVLLKQMHEAVVIADFDRVLELIQQVEAQSPAVAQSLRQLAEQFNSEKLLELTETKTT
jgi:PAS domain S-box-containing protein